MSGAGEAVTFNQLTGGTLTGDFLGSTGFVDILNIALNGDTGASSLFTLTHNIMQTVDVVVGSGATLDVDGARMIDGNLTSDGTIAFVLGTDTLTVAGDVTLNTGSIINVADTNGQVTAAGQQFTLIDTGGTLTNNATLETTAVDNSFLLDFIVLADPDSQDVVVEATLASAPPPPPPPTPPPPPPPAGMSPDPTPLDPTPVTATALTGTAGPVVVTQADGSTLNFASGTPVVNPSDPNDSGAVISLDAGVQHTIADGTDSRPRGSNISLDSGENDVTVNIAGELISLDSNDENTAIFFDNAEDNLTINVASTAIAIRSPMTA